MGKNEIAPVKNEIVVYQPNETLRLEVSVQDETVWLTQAQIAELFGTKRPAITKHLANIYRDGELEEQGTCSILEHMGHGGVQKYGTRYYNLDAILSVGYRVNSRNATLFRRWATSVLKEHLLRGYSFNARLAATEDRIDRRLAKHDADIVELQDKVDFFVRTELPPREGVVFEGQIKDAYDLALSIIRQAKRSVVLIDNWVDERVLTMLEARGPKVSATIYTKNCTKKLQLDVANHNRQYRPITLKAYRGAHDRFLIVDSTVYHIGASLKDLGTALCAFSRMEMPASVILARLP